MGWNGRGNPRNSLNGGYGIYKSLDAGRTWTSMGLEKTRHIHKVIIDPTNPDVVYVGAIGSPWGIHEERGVYKTTNGGDTWERVLFQNTKTGVADMVMDPTNPNKLIVGRGNTKETLGSLKVVAKALECLSHIMEEKLGKNAPIKMDCQKANWAALG